MIYFKLAHRGQWVQLQSPFDFRLRMDLTRSVDFLSLACSCGDDDSWVKLLHQDGQNILSPHCAACEQPLPETRPFVLEWRELGLDPSLQIQSFERWFIHSTLNALEAAFFAPQIYHLMIQVQAWRQRLLTNSIKIGHFDAGTLMELEVELEQICLPILINTLTSAPEVSIINV